MEKGRGFIPSQEDIMNFLDSCYRQCLNGIPVVSPSIDVFANDYLLRNKTADNAAKSMIQNQVIKCTTSGFITGFGGAITMPVTIPANIGSVMYVQMRMIACTAYLAGYDVNTDQVQTLVYACLVGVSLTEVVKKFGVKFGEKLAVKMVEKIPGKVLTKINQKIGFRLFTKFGEKGLINIGKMVPVAGAFINGGFDLVETQIIGNRSYDMFFNGDFSAGDNGNNPVIDESDLEDEE